MAARSAKHCGGVCRGDGYAGAGRENGGGPSCIGDRARPRHSRAHCGDGSQGVGISDHQSAGDTMIPLPNGSRVWIAAGHSDMRRGMHSLALQVQEALKRDPHAGDLYVFRGFEAILSRYIEEELTLIALANLAEVDLAHI